MKFLADCMLGRLAKWLRLLGYDTAYQADADDPALVRQARAEDRVLLTRDVELTRRRGVRVFLIESEQIEAQLRQMWRALNLTPRAAFTRCPECNLPLDLLSAQAARPRVAPYVFLTHTEFRACPGCQRVYWRGTHWARIVAALQDLSDETPLS